MSVPPIDSGGGTVPASPYCTVFEDGRVGVLRPYLPGVSLLPSFQVPGFFLEFYWVSAVAREQSQEGVEDPEEFLSVKRGREPVGIQPVPPCPAPSYRRSLFSLSACRNGLEGPDQIRHLILLLSNPTQSLLHILVH